jgi:hypothetical protein
MHGAALRLLMNDEQRKITAEYGYLRSISYVEEFQGDDGAEEVRAESWTKVERHGEVESKILDDTKKFLKKKKDLKLDNLVENKEQLKKLLADTFPEAMIEDKLRKMKSTFKK